MSPTYLDLYSEPEDKRIDTIGSFVINTGSYNTGFVVDKSGDYLGKGNRYIKKLLKKFPGIEVKSRFDGPVKDTETIIVGLK